MTLLAICMCVHGVKGVDRLYHVSLPLEECRDSFLLGG